MSLPKCVISSDNEFLYLENKLILLVNIASECNLCDKSVHRMYQLAELHPELMILAYPSNDFNQEPSSPDEIKIKFTKQFGEIPSNLYIMKKINIIGANTEPIFSYVKSKSKYLKFFTEIRWNYEKFIITPDGFVERFSPMKNWDEVNLYINGFCNI